MFILAYLINSLCVCVYIYIYTDTLSTHMFKTSSLILTVRVWGYQQKA